MTNVREELIDLIVETYERHNAKIVAVDITVKYLKEIDDNIDAFVKFGPDCKIFNSEMAIPEHLVTCMKLSNKATFNLHLCASAS